MELEREFFYDEVRDGFYIPGMMKRAWGAELAILSEVDRICKKYDIPYYAGGGTLIGAVRDGQFIPWDDDIDIMMLREDFKRFRQLAKTELPKELSLLTIEENKNNHTYISSVAKVCYGFNSERLRKYQEFPYMISLDLFVLDELPNKPEEEKDWEETLCILNQILNAVQKKEDEEIIRNWIKNVENKLEFRFDLKKDLETQLYFILDTLFQKFNGRSGDRIACVPWHFFRKNFFYPRIAFENTLHIPFCNMQLPIPNGYDAILRAEYGDYLKKVKGGGEHGYPEFKQYEEICKNRFKEQWKFDYCFSEEDCKRPDVENFRCLTMKMLDFFVASQNQVFEDYERGNILSCLSRLSAMQEEAIALGNAIEQNKGEGSKSVSVLEEYCEALYHAYQSLIGLKEEGKDKKENKDKEESKEEICFPIDFSPSLQKELQRKLKKPLSYLKELRMALKEEFKKQVVFLPHTVKHFASLRPLVDALLEEEEIECKIIPIPYYDKYGDGTLKELHYEGEEFPKEYEIIDYHNYNFARELPDCIVINSPYDDFNPVWTVDPNFYSSELKKYTNKLIYIPWFVTDEIDPKSEEDGKAFTNMEYYVTVPGLFHSDFTIVQSEGMKKAYLAKIEEFAGKDVAKKMEKKISGAGSCLLGDKEGQGIKEVVKEFKNFL